MNLILRLLGSLLLGACMACILIFIVLLPRDTISHRVGDVDVMAYHFTWNKYKQNIDHFFEEVRTSKSLGITAFDEPVEVELSLYFKRSMIILLPAMLISIVAGIAKGVFDYRFRHKWGRIFGKGPPGSDSLCQHIMYNNGHAFLCLIRQGDFRISSKKTPGINRS